MEYVRGNPVSGPLPPLKPCGWRCRLRTRSKHPRDLKPSNILLMEQGVKLLDFSLAGRVVTESIDDSVAAGQGGMVFGTIAYVFPERLDGNVDLI
jgi:serine/threonine protein kinase